MDFLLHRRSSMSMSSDTDLSSITSTKDNHLFTTIRFHFHLPLLFPKEISTMESPLLSYNPSSSFRFLGPTSSKFLFSTVLRLRDPLPRRRNSISLIGDGQSLMNMCRERLHLFRCSFNAFSGTSLMSLSFFSGNESRRDNNNDTEMSKSQSKSPSRQSGRNWFERYKWTSILLASNVLVFFADTSSYGKLSYWGAKINVLIRQGQWWRLVTSSFLHANLMHLMANCYSLYVLGPSVEDICGPKRYLTIYMASAVASSAMSYRFNKAHSVGASGAIAGMVGFLVVYLLRNRDLLKGTDESLKQIAQVILLNATIGLLIKGIDNWGHIGGLIGGAAVTWLVGPAWEVQYISSDGKKVIMDKALISSLFGKHPNQ